MSRASLAASRAPSSSALASSACSRASSAAASAASRRPAARSAAFSARSSSRSRERRSAARLAELGLEPPAALLLLAQPLLGRLPLGLVRLRRRLRAPLGGLARRCGGNVGAGQQPPGAAALGVLDHAPGVQRGAHGVVGGDRLERGPQLLERRPAGLATARLQLLRLRHQRVDRRTLGRRRLAQRVGALAGDGRLLRRPQLVGGGQEVVDEVAVLAGERVGRPCGLGRLRQLGHHRGGVALLRLAQLAGGGVALAREVLQRQAVEPAGDVLDRVSHLRPARRR